MGVFGADKTLLKLLPFLFRTARTLQHASHEQTLNVGCDLENCHRHEESRQHDRRAQRSLEG